MIGILTEFISGILGTISPPASSSSLSSHYIANILLVQQGDPVFNILSLDLLSPIQLFFKMGAERNLNAQNFKCRKARLLKQMIILS